jgi:uncharacterized protein
MNATKIYRLRWSTIYLPICLSAAAAFVLLSAAYMPLPPSAVTISAGRPGGMYYAHAQQYAVLLQERGIELKVLESAGSGENLKRLRSTERLADFAFVQGGYAVSEAMSADSAAVQTLANVDIEPIWVFSRFKDVDSLLRLQGYKVSIGQEGSGSRAVALRMLQQVQLEPKDLQVSEVVGRATVDALKDGTLDAAIFVAAASAPIVQELLITPGVYLALLKRSAALNERMPHLDARFVAAGSLHAQRKQPTQDSILLSTVASVLVREDTHPLLKRLMTDVLMQTHRRAGPLHRAGEFPHLKRLEFPSAPQARDVLRSDLTWLEDKLSPIWAQRVYRFLFIGLPLMAIAALLCHAARTYLHWRVQSSINRWYGELKYIENSLRSEKPGGLDLARFRNKILRIGGQVKQARVPSAYLKRMYMLQQHIDLVLTELTVSQTRAR